MLLMNTLTVNMLHTNLTHLKHFFTLENDANVLLKNNDNVAVQEAKPDCGLKTAEPSQSFMEALPFINLQAAELTAEWVAYTALPQAPDFCIVAAKKLGAKKDAAQAAKLQALVEAILDTRLHAQKLQEEAELAVLAYNGSPKPDTVCNVMICEVLLKRVETTKNKANAAVAKAVAALNKGVLAQEAQRKIKAAEERQIIKDRLHAAKQAHSQVFLGPSLKVKKERASQNG